MRHYRPAVRERMPEVLALMVSDGIERIDVEPLGGVGYSVGETGFAIVNLDELEDKHRSSGQLGRRRTQDSPSGHTLPTTGHAKRGSRTPESNDDWEWAIAEAREAATDDVATVA